MSALRLFGRAGAAAGAVAAAASSSTTVHARAPTQVAPQQTEHRSVVHGKCVDDDWLVLQPQHGDIILMKPFEACEVDDAMADVAQLMKRRSGARPAVRSAESHPLLQHEEGSGSPVRSGASTPTSAGSAADTQISATFLTASGMRASGVWRDEPAAPGGVVGAGMDISMDTLLDLTSRMLKRPGMQVELVKAMMEDREIQEILLRESSDLDSYLLAAGALPVHSLLPPAAAAATQTSGVARDGAQEGQSEQEDNPLAGLVNAVLSALEHASAGMGNLLGWVRGRVALLLGHTTTDAASEAQAEADAGAADGKGKAAGGNRARAVLQGVLAVAAVVVVVLLFKRGPAGFRRASPFARR